MHKLQKIILRKQHFAEQNIILGCDILIKRMYIVVSYRKDDTY